MKQLARRKGTKAGQQAMLLTERENFERPVSHTTRPPLEPKVESTQTAP